ncbi:MAG: flagellar hook-associated protein FlgL [Desulfobacterales bacterium]|nr:flagellar hook-associated protein FlgL [Desulfobacterales bacterium]
MRVADKTLYDTTKYRLDKLKKDLNKANVKMSSGKNINSLSDDPVGLTQILDLKAGIDKLQQYDRNIQRGKVWLNTEEAALLEVKDLLDEAKHIALNLSDGKTLTNEDKTLATNQIESFLNQAKDLANTKVQGQYVFSGTKTDTMPFTFDSESNPAKSTYSGNSQNFSIKIAQDTNVPIGHNGKDVFSRQTIVVGNTNNKIDFSEDSGTTTLTGTIASGEYTPAQLATEVQNAMNAASGGANYTVTYDSTNERFSIASGLPNLEVYWESGPNANKNIAPLIGFGASGDVNGVTQNGDSGDQWSIFKTLIDLRDNINSDQGAGINRAISRLTSNFNDIMENMSDNVTSTQVRLQTREKIISEMLNSFQDNKQMIEEADTAESILDLKSKELAYQVSLQSSAKVLKISLADYL